MIVSVPNGHKSNYVIPSKTLTNYIDDLEENIKVEQGFFIIIFSSENIILMLSVRNFFYLLENPIQKDVNTGLA
jgi:hypothetical protein